ncbi:MAG TPA: ABC transporter permease subunit [Dongiaceae bacterium]|jgi:polar amino acid transport system permease protein/octopine/nopaline transport system permease protein|nr:ABC transporter permease subunit [Dongiaceae bacterium]
MGIEQCYAFLQTAPGPGFDVCFMLWTVIPALIKAIPVSLFLVFTSGIIGNLMAVPVAVARVSHNPVLWMPSYAFILLMRGTPLLVQIYLIYYGLGQVFGDMTLFGKPLMRALPFLREGIYYAIFALSLNTAGYTGEILRGAILAVPHGEIEAGKAFGMSPWLIFRRVTLPRAIRICLPAMSTETILLLKATALASTITVYEVLGTAQFIRSQTYRIYETLISAGLVYIVLVFLLTRLMNWLERYLNKDRERPVSMPRAQVAKP